MRNRIEYLDFLRGIAIIFVVMGHVLQYNFHGEAATGCFNYIYSFHMGFFFFISGCVASLSSQKNIWNNFLPFIGKKACQLLIPFFVWGTIIPFLLCDISITDLPGRFLQIIQYPDNSVWFLLFLFFIQVVYFICCALTANAKGNNTRLIVLLCSLPIVVLLLYIEKKFLGPEFIWISPEYLLLFIIGHIIQTINIKDSYVSPLIFFSFLLFVIIVPLFDFWQSNLFKIRVIKVLTSISFSLFAYYIVKMQYNNLNIKLTKYVVFLGTHTLEIYVTHYSIVQICMAPWLFTGTINTIPLFMIILLLSVPICFLVVFITEVLKKIPGLSLVLYGQVGKG